MIYYVNASAPREGNGLKETPFRHIDDAARIAVAGDEIIVAPGIYREKVTPRNAGREDARIVYRSEKPLGAVITGAEVFTGWKKYKGNVWVNRVSNGVFGDYNPYTTMVCGDWYFAPTVRHTGSVFLNDKMMYETVTLEECEAGEADPCAWNLEESTWKWYTEQDGDETVIYANFHGLDPNQEKVELVVRRNCFMPDENGISYITVSGFDINKGATTWAPPAAYQDGLIGPHWSKGWIIEDCEVWGSRCCGISLGKYLDPENDMYFYRKHVKSPTQMERDAVCRGQYHGWLKEKVGSHLIRRCHIHNCIMGIWFDWQAQGARITQNLLHDNMRPEGRPQARGAMFSNDVFIEVGHGPTLIDNNVMLSKAAAAIPSEGVAFVHNLTLGAFVLVNSGVDSVVNGQREPRYTPYHIRHRTEVAGFMTILHGDDRIYNNIFIQQHPITDESRQPTASDYEVVGTAPFDIFPTYEEWIANFMMGEEPNMGHLAQFHFGHLPVWVEGNAYFNGATVYAKEKHNLVEKEGKVCVELTEDSGRCVLKTNVYDFLKDFRDGQINSDLLGCAFEPEQRFENPDGTAIQFDRDYFGGHRGVETLPGPFAEGKDCQIVW